MRRNQKTVGIFLASALSASMTLGDGRADAVVDRDVTPIIAPGNGWRGGATAPLSDGYVRVQSDHALHASDVNTEPDVYVVAVGSEPIVASGSIEGGSVVVGQDNDEIYFESNAGLVPSDTDGTTDIYAMTFTGVRRIVTPNTHGVLRSLGVSQDGTKVWVSTNAALLPSDTDSDTDYYEFVDGTARHLTAEDHHGSSTVTDFFTTSDGQLVGWTTNEPMLELDTDSVADIYTRDTSGVIELRTPNTPNAVTSVVGDPLRTDHVVGLTTSALVSADVDDSRVDLYSFSDDGTATGLTTSGNGAFDVSFVVARAEHVLVRTSDLLQGTGANGTAPYLYTVNLRLDEARFVAADASQLAEPRLTDSGRVFVATDASKSAGDGDAHFDVYQVAEGQFTLISDLASTSDVFAPFAWDERVLLSTTSALVSDDTDTALDVYERRQNGTTRLVDSGHAHHTQIGGADRDGIEFTLELDIDGSSDFGLQLARFAAPVALTTPEVVGRREVGRRVRCAGASFDGDGLGPHAFNWFVAGAPVPLAVTSSFEIRPTDAGRLIRCRVTGSNVAGSATRISETVRVAPHFANRPTVTGRPVVGHSLACSGRAVGASNIVFRWFRDGVGTAQRTQQYRIRPADVGHRLSCLAIATNAGGSATARSTTVLVRTT